jgi:mono/diheme cytochrome c family protein
MKRFEFKKLTEAGLQALYGFAAILRVSPLVMTLLIFTTFQTSAQNRTREGQVRELYDHNCSGCHGLDPRRRIWRFADRR